MEANIAKVQEMLMTYGLDILAALVIVIVGRWMAKLVTGFFNKITAKANMDAALSSFLSHLIYIGLMTFVVIAALSKLGIQTTSFIAVVGAAGLAVGLALQGSLANFAAGVLIILFKPFKVGHFIVAGGERGTVQEITIFHTVLNSPDNARIVMPNAQITGGSITNYSANETRRVDLEVGVSYSDDLKKTKEVLTGVVASYPGVLKDPAPVIAVKALGDSSVVFVVRPWVKATEYWPSYFGLTEKIKLELDRNHITIPFPQRDIHIKSGEPALAGNGHETAAS
ncbi:MAG TPA: mechanosensitive ion channel domain-containing protein [bacterium]|nr:mechanosensitive ion channel domain-containing protein [bacterium]